MKLRTARLAAIAVVVAFSGGTVAGATNFGLPITPEAYCQEDHDHYAMPAHIDTRALLDWARKDTGFNEGASFALAALSAAGISAPIAPIAGALAGNLLTRREMMNLARDISRGGLLPIGMAIALSTQVHNCHAYKWLLAHPAETANWLLTS